MKIKICGLCRKEDIDYINEARPDYAGFVFAESRRQISPIQAETFCSRLAEGIVPVGVFVNAPITEIAALYSKGIIAIAQLHGTEDGEYITKLKDLCAIPVIKTIIFCESSSFLLSQRHSGTENSSSSFLIPNFSFLIDYYLFDSGKGTGKTFDWDLLEPEKINKSWFLAGGINLENIEKAIALNPYAIDISSGAETGGIKDREKIIKLMERAVGRKGNMQ